MTYQQPAERLAASVRVNPHAKGAKDAETAGDHPSPPSPGWLGPQKGDLARDIALDDLRSLIRKPDAVILDGRPSLFYETGHITGALNLSRKDFERDFKRLESRLREFSPDNRHAAHATGHALPLQIVVYCADSSCDDSQIVAEALARLGYGPIGIFKGGWEAWVQGGGEVAGGKGSVDG